jgi:hypothetical protein
MKFAPIAPTTMTGGVAQTSDYLMALPTQARVASYSYDLQRARERNNSYLMLDNGVSELKRPIRLDELCAITQQLEPDEVILPDYLGDDVATKVESNSAAKILRALGYEGKLMGVPQGQTMEDYLTVIEYFLTHFDISTIGLSKYFPSFANRPREDLLYMIEGRGLLERRQDVEWHLLGLCENLGELTAIARRYPWLRGIDTCYPVLASMQGIQIVLEPSNIVTSPEGFETATADAYGFDENRVWNLLPANITHFKKVCNA